MRKGFNLKTYAQPWAIIVSNHSVISKSFKIRFDPFGHKFSALYEKI